jgi:hypothetical protein
MRNKMDRVILVGTDPIIMTQMVRAKFTRDLLRVVENYVQGGSGEGLHRTSSGAKL